MAILNIIRCSAYNSQQVHNCIATLLTDDTIVLIDDGSYNITHPSITTLLTTHKVAVIQAHAQARALSISQNIKAITMKELNDLIFTHDNVVTWQ